MRKVRQTVTVNPEEWAEFIKILRANGQSASWMVRHLIKEFLKHNKQVTGNKE